MLPRYGEICLMDAPFKTMRYAKADTEAKYTQVLYQLRSSTIWKDHERLRLWMQGTWLPQFKVSETLYILSLFTCDRQVFYSV